MSYSKPLIAAAVASVVALAPLASPATAQPAPATVKAAAGQAKAFKIATYNIQKPSKSRPWSKRRTKIASTVKARQPDVFGIQEANGPHKGATIKFPARDLKRLLPGYAIVKTRSVRGQREESITGRYLLYRTKRFTPGRSGELYLGHSSYAVWATFYDRSTGARFVVTNSHLVNGNSASRDRLRRAQTRLLLSKMRKANVQKLPVLHLGDFNTHRDHVSDAPTKVFKAAGYKNTYSAARKRVAARYNGNNQLRRTPPKKYMHPDYIWVPKGTAVGTWSQVLKLRRGKFVGTIPSDHNPIFTTVRVRYDR